MKKSITIIIICNKSRYIMYSLYTNSIRAWAIDIATKITHKNSADM